MGEGSSSQAQIIYTHIYTCLGDGVVLGPDVAQEEEVGEKGGGEDVAVVEVRQPLEDGRARAVQHALLCAF